MRITKSAKAGTMESNDIYVMVMPNEDSENTIELESIVMKQFGDQIMLTIEETLKELNVENATIIAKDRGALDYTIKARIETAVKRGI